MNNLLIGLTPTYVFSQVFAFVTLCLASVSYFCRSKKVFFLLQTGGNFFIVLSFLFLGEIFGCIGTLIATIRTGIFAVYEIREKEVPWWLVGLIIGALLFTVIWSYNTPYDIMYFIGLCIYVVSFKIKNFISLKLGLFFGCVLYVIYDLVLYNYVNAISHTVELASIVASVAISLLGKKKRKEKAIKRCNINGYDKDKK